MIHLPSGRCVALSSDRMVAYIQHFNAESATRLYSALQEPDDLLHILDVVYLGQQATDGMPYFAGYVASQWETYAQDWPTKDKEAFHNWLYSGKCHAAREHLLQSLKCKMSTMEFPQLMS